jgi:hypothetical protein
MQFFSILALLEKSGSSGFDDMLRLIGIAAIISAVFKGIKSLFVKPVPPAATPAMEAPKRETSATPAAPSPSGSAGDMTPEIVAVIAAAVATLTAQPHRIVSIRRQSTSWEKAGRQSVLTSHRIR